MTTGKTLHLWLWRLIESLWQNLLGYRRFSHEKNKTCCCLSMLAMMHSNLKWGCPARCILSMVDVCLCVRAKLSIMLSPGAQLLNAISRVVVLSWQGGRVHRKEASPIAICPPPLPSLPPPSDVPLHIYSRQTL